LLQALKAMLVGMWMVVDALEKHIGTRKHENTSAGS
jgi:hypothetical protein